MDDTNPQIESALDDLADLVCETFRNDSQDLNERTDGLLKTLLMSGYTRKAGSSLPVEIEKRVKDRCGEPAMHRGGALSSITAKLSQKLHTLAQWESRSPQDKKSAKAANISSATDA